MDMSITLIAVIVVAIVLLKFAKQIASKLLGVVLIAGVILGYMYKNSVGPFKTNVADMNTLSEKYCGPDGDQDICDCILVPVKNDIESRFNKSERDSLEVQKIKAAYVLQKSLRATKESALACLAIKGKTEKYKVFLQDFVPIENKYLDMVGEKARDLGDKLKEEVSTFKDNKENIDSKY
jgi:hypothetical protein